MIEWHEFFNEHARQVYSEHGEDGIIEAIFGLVGTTNRKLVDLGAGNGWRASNTNELLRTGWTGTRIDLKDENDVHGCRLTADNVCNVLVRYEVPEEPDFLSIDIDGVDWYVLRAVLRQYNPRVFVCEINPALLAWPGVVVAYDPAFVFASSDYFGASLGAYLHLAMAHGYTCIGVHANINAFFIRDDVAPDGTPLQPRYDFTPYRTWPPDPQARTWVPDTDLDWL